MSKEYKSSLEIMGYYKLEPYKYMKPKNAKTCPLRKNRYCDRHDCALWNEEKSRCGLLK